MESVCGWIFLSSCGGRTNGIKHNICLGGEKSKKVFMIHTSLYKCRGRAIFSFSNIVSLRKPSVKDLLSPMVVRPAYMSLLLRDHLS